METRRLRLLVELARLGSMREVAEEMGLTTSTVSQQLAILARDTGAALVEPDGRRVRLTPAGRRLAAHGVTILAAVEAARLDLDPSASPAGELRVAGFATAIRRTLLPAQARLARDHPRVRLLIHEHEPFEAFALLDGDDVDLALTYDYNLAPVAFPDRYETRALWTVPWGLAVPAGTTLADAWERDWIVNSRNTADEEVARTLASLNGFTPRIVHRCDSLDLVQDLIVAGLGVGLLPADETVVAGIEVLPLRAPAVELRAYAVNRRGRTAWPPLALVVGLLRS
ncbi:LysR family transcriptional regulator [Paractinoplanes toevensis]|uniref:LysR family transcriptional regulator n=1 Tax=Paractinoplanes toevensis TaxID=571911 RepID=A0A919TIH4_9ACTN|nr:LysR family transcriptional regulator [Actinoplanes toevensis]GIM94990.1 LysR family transcriptional regulator [Actinoplanes toevensis]